MRSIAAMADTGAATDTRRARSVIGTASRAARNPLHVSIGIRPAGRELVLACTYAVVVFSILAQGLTVRRVLVHYRVSEPNR